MRVSKDGEYEMDANLLRYHIKRNGDTHRMLAMAIGIGESTLYRKLQGKDAEFTQREIKSIIERYKLTGEEVLKVFFGN